MTLRHCGGRVKQKAAALDLQGRDGGLSSVAFSFRSGRDGVRRSDRTLDGSSSAPPSGGWRGPPMLNRGPPPPRPPLSSLVSFSFSFGRLGESLRASRPVFAFPVGLGPLGLLARQADLPLAAVDAEDLDLDLVADLDDFLGAVDLVVGQLGDVQQAFQARLEPDEDAEVGQLGDLALDDVARLVPAGDVGLPGVFARAA